MSASRVTSVAASTFGDFEPPAPCFDEPDELTLAVTVKLDVAALPVPESVSGPVVAIVLWPDTMLMEPYCVAGLSIGPLPEVVVAEALTIVTVPKLASGKMPR